MKKLIIVVLVVLVGWVGVNYLRTGKISLLPAEMSEEDRRLKEFETELASIESQIAAAGRSAGMTGMDTTGQVGPLLERKEKLEKEIARLRGKMD